MMHEDIELHDSAGVTAGRRDTDMGVAQFLPSVEIALSNTLA